MKDKEIMKDSNSPALETFLKKYVFEGFRFASNRFTV